MAPRKTIIHARALRRMMSPPEVRLWGVLRARPNGLRFRRQHPIGVYVLDFYCPAVKVAIEVDGYSHDVGDRPERDARRDGWLAEQGIVTLRIAARDVMANLNAVVRLAVDRCALPLHHAAHGPPPHAGHGED